MYDDISFLEYIYEKSKIEQELIGGILKKIIELRNIELYNVNIIIKEQLYNYRKIASSAKTMLERRNKKIKEISIFSKMMKHMSVKINITAESETKDIINILIQESKINIDEIIKNSKEAKIKSKSIRNLSDRFIIYEQEFISKLKIIKIRESKNI